MSTVIFYISLPFIYLVSLLPLRVHYILSDLLYFLLYHVFGYRRTVVTTNMENAFPDRTPEEIDALRKAFYRYLCDLTLESIKSITISPGEVARCFVFDDADYDLMEHYYRKKQSVILVLGHMGNWELTGAFFAQMELHPLYVIYHPMANPHMDQLFLKARKRNGINLYPMKEAYKCIVRDKDKLTATAFVADQTPKPDNAHWMTFLNQDTPVFKGTENAAKMLDFPVVYAAVIRQKRGLYKLQVELLTEHPKEFAEHELTELHTRRLERDIVEYPETWLWSHRRWKHKRPEPRTENN